MVSLRHFIIEIKPSASGLCWDTKTLSGVAKITSKPEALAEGFEVRWGGGRGWGTRYELIL
jgi:hypothetical protein